MGLGRWIKKSFSNVILNELNLSKSITIEEKQMLWEAVDGINGWNFNPIAVVTNNMKDYYFICKVKTVIKKFRNESGKSVH